MSDEVSAQQWQEFLSFFKYVLKNQALFEKFITVLDDSEEMIYLAVEYVKQLLE